jgi:hypothetical protein
MEETRSASDTTDVEKQAGQHTPGPAGGENAQEDARRQELRKAGLELMQKAMDSASRGQVRRGRRVCVGGGCASAGFGIRVGMHVRACCGGARCFGCPTHPPNPDPSKIPPPTPNRYRHRHRHRHLRYRHPAHRHLATSPIVPPRPAPQDPFQQQKQERRRKRQEVSERRLEEQDDVRAFGAMFEGSKFYVYAG